MVNVGLGGVTFGREIDEETSYKLIDHAVGMGISSIDTAAAYGGGASEKIIGNWLAKRGLKDGLTLATKILPPYDAPAIRLAVEASLKRLGIDTIDLLYLHRWDDLLINPDAWVELSQLQAEGKFKELGVSNFNTTQLNHTVELLQTLNLIQLNYIQNNHNLAVSDLTDEMKRLCAQNSIRIVTYSPLGAGFLTGKHNSGVQQNSRFDIMPAHQDIYFNPIAKKRVDKLMKVSAAIGAPPALLAMAWALHQPQVYSVLVGGRTTDQLDLVNRAMKFYLPEIFAELETV